MAGFLISLAASLTFGVALGVLIVWRRARKAHAAHVRSSLHQWQLHCEAHAKALEGSTMISPPGLRVISYGNSYVSNTEAVDKHEPLSTRNAWRFKG